MTRIFFYELKRLLWNQFFVGILAVILFAGWQILNQVTLLGVEHTAPFSVQSFCDYLFRLLPLLWISTLFFLSFFFSKPEQRASVITHATPVNPLIYAVIRCSAVFVGSDSCRIPSGCCILRKIFSLVSLENSVNSWLPNSNPDITD